MENHHTGNLGFENSSPDALQAVTAWSEGLSADALGNLAHELRTPLQVLLGLLDILRDECADDDRKPREIIERMNINAFELEQTLNNLMLYALSKAGKNSLIDEELSLDSILADIGPALEAANHRKQLDLRFDLQDAPGVLRAPRRAITMVLLNLALNAIKFTETGSVTIRIAQQLSAEGAATIELAVSDTGPGLSPALLDCVSQPFAQLSRSSTRLYRGVGLGLAVVRLQAKTLGGTLELFSRPGEGATFLVRFPLRGAMIDVRPKNGPLSLRRVQA